MKRIAITGFFFIAAIFLALPKTYAQAVGSFDAVILSSSQPPSMPDLDQPPCPLEGQLWQPGFWSYDSTLSDYYWIPGAWVAPPEDGLLWTPGYWNYANGLYDFHPGYWGSDVGFYGGVNYGFGYFGLGYSGGSWKRHHFHYNTAVTHVNTKVVHNTYVDNTVVVNNATVNHVSFNGPGGIIIKPRPEEERVTHERHVEATQVQISYMQAARNNPDQFRSANHGRPTTTYINQANRSSFMAHTPRNNGNTAGNQQQPRTPGNNRPQRTIQHSSPQRSQHNSQHYTQQRTQRTQHTNPRSSTPHSSAQHTQHTTSQHYTQQHTQQTQQYKTQQQHTQLPRTQQQHTQQQRTQQSHFQQQPRVQPRVQQQQPRKHT